MVVLCVKCYMLYVMCYVKAALHITHFTLHKRIFYRQNFDSELMNDLTSKRFNYAYILIINALLNFLSITPKHDIIFLN